ncbi:MAG: hypothetical protein HRU38_10585 [Saccharospirillaceae bacterium]|nr:hypothetical protein [Pseudomonadales bacterium]NRB79100.1 hypothetical protein [Saccharospirillaceae bacterium]
MKKWMILASVIAIFLLIFIIKNNKQEKISNDSLYKEIVTQDTQPIIQLKENIEIISVKPKKEINILPVVNTKPSEQRCIINKGITITQACSKFKNIDKMDFKKYTNLILHDDIKTMFNYGLQISSKYPDLTLLELGQSDQGKVYQILLFFIMADIDSSQYFFESKLDNAAWIVSDSEMEFIENTTKTGYRLIDLDFNDDRPILSFIKLDGELKILNCFHENQLKFYEENDLSLNITKTCVDFPELELSTYRMKNIVVDGGGFLLNDNVIRQCLDGVVDIFGLGIEINPMTITNIECDSLKGANIEVLKQFVNVKSFQVTRLDNDLSFIKEYKNLESLIISENIDFDINWLTGMSQLKKLYLSTVNISNLENFDYNSIQLKQLSIKNSIVDNIDFLSFQYELTKIDLTNTQLTVMPLLGNNSNLNELILKNNNIKHINDFDQFVNLEILNVSKNEIEYMSNLDLNNSKLKSVNITFNPLDCTDPYLNYSPIVKSSCNRKLKLNL